MKKTAMLVLAIVFLFGATIVVAKAANGNKDFSRPLKVEKVKLFGKKAISDSEREKGNALEQMIIKGTKTAKPAPPTTDPTSGGVTGIEGAKFPTNGKKYAIVIGLSNYPGTSESTTDEILPDLCVQQVPDNDPSVYALADGTYATLDDEIKANCKDGDSVNMEDTLLTKYGFTEGNVARFSDSEATFTAIQAKVEELVGKKDVNGDFHPGILKPEDELVFFFSGHGVIGYGDPDEDIWEDEDGGIVVYDENYNAENEALYKATGTLYTDSTGKVWSNYKKYYDSTGYDSSAYIWDGQLKEWFASSLTKRIFFAFDTCNAAEMDDLEEEINPTNADGVGRVMAFSSGKNESSYTYYLGGVNNSGNIHDGEGLFSHYFVLRAMHDGLADGSNPLRKTSTNPPKKDGKVAVEEAFNYAYPLVRAASSYRQTPVLEDYFTNDLLLGYQL